MKKFKWVWVLGISAAMFLGPLGALDLSGQTFNYCPEDVPFNKPHVEQWVRWTNTILNATIRRIKDMSKKDVLDNIDQLTSPFMKTYLKYPVFVEKEGENEIQTFGWREVIFKLKDIADTFIECGDIEVNHSPSDSPPHEKHDHRFNITTVLGLDPPNDPYIRGCGLHRTSCYPEECQ